MKKRLKLTLLALVCHSIPSLASASAPIPASLSTPTIKECTSDRCLTQFKRLKKFARYGNPEAGLFVARAYLTGDGLDQDVERSYRYFLKAMKKGSREAMFYLQDMTRQGIGTEQDIERADELLQFAIDKKYGPAMYLKAVTTLNLDGSANNNQDEITLLERAVEQNHKPSTYLLANMLEYGEGIEQDEYRAAQLYRKLAPNNYEDSYQRFHQLKNNHVASTNQVKAAKFAALPGDIEVIEVVGRKLSYDAKLDSVVLRIKKNPLFQGTASADSHIRGKTCKESSGACGIIPMEEVKEFLKIH